MVLKNFGLTHLANIRFLPSQGLMEEKGLHHETGTKSGGSGDSSCAAKPDTSSTGSGDKEGKDKPSLKERLKDKLHIHKS